MNIEHFPKLWLPRTGQTTSYADGDDGYYQAGNPRATRLVGKATENITLDRHTGLTWITDPRLIIPGAPVGGIYKVQHASGTWSAAHGTYTLGDLVKGDGDPDALFYVCIQTHTAAGDKEPPNATYWVKTVWIGSAATLNTHAYPAWADAVADCLALDYAGYTDWRLPNLMELLTLFDFEAGAARLWRIMPENTAYRWASTTNAGVTTEAYRAGTGTGSPASPVAKTSATSYIASPVRGGRING